MVDDRFWLIAPVRKKQTSAGAKSLEMNLCDLTKFSEASSSSSHLLPPRLADGAHRTEEL